MVVRETLRDAAKMAETIYTACPDGRTDELQALAHVAANRWRVHRCVCDGAGSCHPWREGGDRHRGALRPDLRGYLRVLMFCYDALCRPADDPTHGALSFECHQDHRTSDPNLTATALIGRYLFLR